MKVVILADSLALPREEVGGERCFEACYPYLLHESLRDEFGKEAPLIIERGMRLRTVEAAHERVAGPAHASELEPLAQLGSHAGQEIGRAHV